MPKLKEYVFKLDKGERFGSLTVFDDNNKYNYLVICECDCGKSQSVRQSSLLSGKVTCCRQRKRLLNKNNI